MGEDFRQLIGYQMIHLVIETGFAIARSISIYIPVKYPVSSDKCISEL